MDVFAKRKQLFTFLVKLSNGSYPQSQTCINKFLIIGANKEKTNTYNTLLPETWGFKSFIKKLAKYPVYEARPSLDFYRLINKQSIL
jgi:hypothetical protein